jgi:ribosomal protein L30
MASITARSIYFRQALARPLTTAAASSSQSPPPTHFKITLTRSAISLGKKVQRTLLALGFHRRFQTVFFPHSPEVAGKILRVKELVRVENVSQEMVMTKQQQRHARKADRGYKILGSRQGAFMDV